MNIVEISLIVANFWFALQSALRRDWRWCAISLATAILLAVAISIDHRHI